MDGYETQRPGLRTRLVVLTVLALGMGTSTGVAVVPAGAGGMPAGLEPVDFPSTSTVFNTGDRVHLVAPYVSKDDRTWHGPYVVYLRPDRPLDGLAGLAPAGEGSLDVAVGNLEINRVDEQYVKAEITFTMPKLEDGRYRVMTCNAKCTNPLGDLYDTTIVVGAVPLPTVPTTLFPPPSTVPTVTAKVGTVATTVPPVAAAASEPTVVRRTVITTNWAAVAAAFAFGIAVAWGLPALLARRRRTAPDTPPLRKHRAHHDVETDVTDFIPVEAVHEESLV